MHKFQVGDKVRVGDITFNDVWPGCLATIVELIDEGKDHYHRKGPRYRAQVDGPPVKVDGTWTNIGQFFESYVSLAEPLDPDVESLKTVADILRAKGYTVKVTVTPPPVNPPTLVL